MVMVSGLGLLLTELAFGATTDGRLVQFPSFPDRQFSQDFFAFIQVQPLQEPDLLCTGGEKRAWYTLFTHAQFPPKF